LRLVSGRGRRLHGGNRHGGRPRWIPIVRFRSATAVLSLDRTICRWHRIRTDADGGTADRTEHDYVDRERWRSDRHGIADRQGDRRGTGARESFGHTRAHHHAGAAADSLVPGWKDTS